MSSEKDQINIIREALVIASLDTSLSMYQLTLKDVDLIAFTLERIMKEKGMKIICKTNLIQNQNG